MKDAFTVEEALKRCYDPSLYEAYQAPQAQFQSQVSQKSFVQQSQAKKRRFGAMSSQ